MQPPDQGNLWIFAWPVIKKMQLVILIMRFFVVVPMLRNGRRRMVRQEGL